MTDEVQTLAEVDSAPAPEETASPEIAQEAPEVVEQTPEETPEEKRFSQAELDAMIGKRLAREQRKWEREQQAKQAEMQARSRVPADLPPADQFESTEAYAQALAEKRAQEMIVQRDAAKRLQFSQFAPTVSLNPLRIAHGLGRPRICGIYDTRA